MSDVQRNGRSLSLPWALALSLGTTLTAGGVAWGVLQSSVEQMRAEQREMAGTLQLHDRQLVELRAQYAEIIRRLDRIELWWNGWFTELKASKGGWFLDIGPRLDQPTEWGAVSWAFRLFGRS